LLLEGSRTKRKGAKKIVGKLLARVTRLEGKGVSLGECLGQQDFEKTCTRRVNSRTVKKLVGRS